MNRKETLQMLELPETATDLQIKKKLEEKLAHFEELSNNSPSAFLRRLNAQQLSKLVLIKKDILSLLQQPILPIKEINEVIMDDVEEEESSLTIPVILSSTSKGSIKKEKNITKTEISEPFAYLIRHTENQSVKPFPLFAGKNYIGRKIHASLKPFLALDDDEFVSRVHAVIYIDDKNPDGSFIDDSALSNEGKPSKNGTFLNGDNDRITGKVKINENDTIQIGETKLIFRINTTQLNKIVEEVEDKDYMHTVVIRI